MYRTNILPRGRISPRGRSGGFQKCNHFYLFDDDMVCI